MAWLKGPLSDGYVIIDDKVRFKNGIRVDSYWGDEWFIDGTNGSDENDGRSAATGKETIQAAITAASAQAKIYIRPQTYKLGTGYNRYTEDVVVALGGDGGSGVVATNANMSLIGITNQQMPTDFLGVRWIYETATPLTVDAPGFSIENIGFFTEGGTYHVNLRCNGATRTQEGTTGFSAYNCAFKGDAKLYANGGNEISIVKCRFQAKYDGTTSGIQLVGSANAIQRPIIKSCHFFGGNTNNMKTAAIVGAAPWYEAFLNDLHFMNDSDSGVFINIAGSSSTGLISDCHYGVADISTTYIVEGGLLVTGAYDGGGLSTST